VAPVTQEQLDYIPEYVSDEVRQRILELTKESEPQVSPVECSDYLIRHWCETVEDGNPLYLDKEYAKSRGFRGTVAQPGMIVCTLSLPFRWPWPPKGYKPQRDIHFQLKELLDLPVGILAEYDQEFYESVQVGDRLSTTSRLFSISPWRKTRLGEGHFWNIEIKYRNQHGRVVARAITTLFAYGRAGSSS
jgi:uncharacterized protein